MILHAPLWRDYVPLTINQIVKSMMPKINNTTTTLQCPPPSSRSCVVKRHLDDGSLTRKYLTLSFKFLTGQLNRTIVLGWREHMATKNPWPWELHKQCYVSFSHMCQIKWGFWDVGFAFAKIGDKCYQNEIYWPFHRLKTNGYEGSFSVTDLRECSICPRHQLAA